jgi:hypothetical protein
MLPVVWPGFQTAFDRRIDPEVLLHETPTGILDRGAALDDASDRRGPSLSVDCLKASYTSVHAA